MMQPQPPAFLPPATSPNAPAAVTIFGVLHLVFAGVGILGALYGILVAIVGNPMEGFMVNGGPEMKAQMEMQAAMQEKTGPMTLATSIVSLLVSIPMIVAGIKLLKRHPNAIGWSNAYAISSLGAKILNLILAVNIMIPAMTEMMDKMIRTASGPKGPGMPPGFLSIMSTFMVVGTIIGVVITCTYPALTLFFLNRPAPKDWIAGGRKPQENGNG